MQRLTYLLILLSAMICYATDPSVDPMLQPTHVIEDQYTCPNGKSYLPSEWRIANQQACRLLRQNLQTYGTTRFPRPYTKGVTRDQFIFPLMKGRKPYRGLAKSFAGNVFIVITYNPGNEACRQIEVVQKITVFSRVVQKLWPGGKKARPQSGGVSRPANGLFRSRYDKCVRKDFYKILHWDE